MSRRNLKRLNSSRSNRRNKRLSKAIPASLDSRTGSGPTFERLEIRSLLAAGILDTTFNSDGRLAIDLNPIEDYTSYESDMAIQADGKVVIVGNHAQGNTAGVQVLRVNLDGTLDESFSNESGDTGWDGGSGRAWLSETATFSSDVQDVLIQADGKILVLTNGSVVRLNTDGRLDTSFGTNGAIDTRTGATGLLPSGKFTAMDMQPDGKIILVGHSQGVTLFLTDFYSVRLLSNGALDTSFGNAGRVQVDIGSDSTATTDAALAVVVQPDGKVVVAGSSRLAFNGSMHYFAAIRLNAVDGSLDTSFDGDGKWFADLNVGAGKQEIAYGVTLDDVGRIILVGSGTTTTVSVSNFLVARLNTNGTLDNSFTGDGYQHYSAGLPSALAYSVDLDANQNLVVGGWGNAGGSDDRFVVSRITPNGAMDTTFNGTGSVAFWPWIEASGTNNTSARDVGVRPDGTIVMSGVADAYSEFEGAIVGGYNTRQLALGALLPNGSFDTDFGTNGIVNYGGVRYSFDEGYSVVGQADGKLLVSGFSGQLLGSWDDFAVVRINPDGSLDTSFDGNGVKTVYFGASSSGGEEHANAVTLQADGRIVLAGAININLADRKFGVVRLNADGSLDTSFGGTGTVTLNPSISHDELLAVAIQPDGKILIGGYTTTSSLIDFALMRLNPDGTTDTSFGVNGLWKQHFGTSSDQNKIRNILVQPDGKILVSSGSGGTGLDAVVARINSNGTLDTTFNGTGSRIFTTLPGNPSGTITVHQLEAATLQSDGKIVLAGSAVQSGSNASNDFIAIRLNTDGSLDTSFDGDGYRVISAAAGNKVDRVYGVTVQQNGRIVLTGQSHEIINNPDFSIVRLNADGSTDTTFGNNGVGIYDMSGTASGYDDPNSADYGRSVYLQPDGNIVVAGFGIKTSGINLLSSDVQLIRVIGDQLPTNINLSDASIVENSPPSSLVGLLSTVDPDSGDTHSYSFVTGIGDSDNAEFAIVGNQLVALVPYDYETTLTRTVRIRTTDQTGSYFEKSITISVLDANEAPIGVAESYTTFEDTPTSQSAPGVLSNDSDPESQTLTAQLVSGTTNGNLVLNPDGSWTYSPNPNSNGIDSFVYRAVDPFGLMSDPITVTIDVVAVNDLPIEAAAVQIVVEDTPGTFYLFGDDGDPELNQALTFTLDSLPTNGTITSFNAATGEVQYAPAANFYGNDSFTYSVSDGNGSSTVATISIVVQPVNDAPVALDDSYVATEDTTLNIAPAGVLANDSDVDGDSLTVTVNTQPLHGMLTLNGNGSFSYVPDANYNGPDQFTYFASDGSRLSLATVNINVLAVDDAPIAFSQGLVTDEDTSLLIGLTGDDGDPELNQGLTYSILTQPANGVITNFNSTTGAMTYTPNANYNGSDSFTFTVNDGSGTSTPATINIVVNPINDAPTADAGADISGFVGDTINLAGQFGDVDLGDSHTFTWQVMSTNNQVIADGTGTAFSFVPDQAGTYTVVFTVRDNFGAEASDFLVVEIESNVTFDPAEISGLVWEDFNADGEVNFGERVIAGSQITLTGIDDLGNAVYLTDVSDLDGYFMFYNLRPGSYSLSELQPAGFTDGIESLGTINGIPGGAIVGNDQFGNINLTSGSVAINYNFAERADGTGQVVAGQTATIGFWQNKNGRALVLSLNGGASSTQLSSWLATTFPNMYGANAGSNNLTGKTNLQVWEKYNSIFRRKQQEASAMGLGGPVKMDAQVFATAFAVYVTNQTLAGNAATSFGFTVTQSGVGAATFNVGSSGQAFGVANGSVVSVLDLLLAVNARSCNGVLYDMDSDGDSNDGLETDLRTLVNNTFSTINEQGDI